MKKYLNADDIQQLDTLLFILGIAAETEELTTQQTIDATIAISLFVSDRAKANAEREAMVTEPAAVQQ